MNKEIEKLQKKLHEAKNERVRAEVRYNTHVVIVEGTRDTLKNLEEINQKLLSDLMESSHVVGEFNKQLQVQMDSDSNNEQKLQS